MRFHSNRAAAYELALGNPESVRGNYKPGDQISYYIKATPKKVPTYESAKPASEFDPEKRDENVDYYIAKLDDSMKKIQRAHSGGVRAETGELGTLASIMVTQLRDPHIVAGNAINNPVFACDPVRPIPLQRML